MKQTEILIESTIDGTMQPSLFYSASKSNRPLLVSLHTWSHNRFNRIETIVPFAEKYDFNLLLPEFRGSNLDNNEHCTLACASLHAKQDIKDAIDYVVKNSDIDADNIFMLGCSGGGHMALMMCGFCPEYFKAVAAFVPITDLNEWIEQNENYRRHVLACCSYSQEEMRLRSPINCADTIAKANLKIFHGKYDPVVPHTHSLELYKLILQKHPDARVFLDIFDGGHELDLNAAAYWFLSQYENKVMTEVTG
jgi:dipeptidyl aminopeptidase/acylaminoacyl peptidase